MKLTTKGSIVEVADGFIDLAYLMVHPTSNILVTGQGANLVHRIGPDDKEQTVIAGNGSEDEPIRWQTRQRDRSL